MLTEYQDLIDNLLAIIIIDLVLAGDNAILIALATQNLEKTLQRKAIIWGSLGAIVIRTLMTFIAIYLLKIPGLNLIGGLALLYIAYQLLSDVADDEHGPGQKTFWGAMKTILIADAVMGIDNVLAIAGASEGHMPLVVVGLIISVPIVVFGSTIVLKLLERYSWLIYLGAAVLIITGVKMIVHEPLLNPWIDPEYFPMKEFILIAGALFIILGLGYRSRKAALLKSKK